MLAHAIINMAGMERMVAAELIGPRYARLKANSCNG
jgi:hypothetical protein